MTPGPLGLTQRSGRVEGEERQGREAGIITQHSLLAFLLFRCVNLGSCDGKGPALHSHALYTTLHITASLPGSLNKCDVFLIQEQGRVRACGKLVHEEFARLIRHTPLST